MSDEDDFGIPDEEEPPEKLRRKWEAEEFEDEFAGKQTVPCPHCGKLIEKKSFSCIYCGERVFTDSGLLGRIAKWISGGKFFIVLALALVLIMMFVMVRL